MGDKGGKKDESKSQRQVTQKRDQKTKEKRAKQPSSTP